MSRTIRFVQRFAIPDRRSRTGEKALKKISRKTMDFYEASAKITVSLYSKKKETSGDGGVGYGP